MRLVNLLGTKARSETTMELHVNSLPISWFHQHSLLLFLLILGGCGGDWWSRGVPDPHERSSRVPPPQQKRSSGVPDPQQERGSPLLRFDAARCRFFSIPVSDLPSIYRYEYEDRLIMGLIGPKEVSDGKETPLIQPLNFRLPVSIIIFNQSIHVHHIHTTLTTGYANPSTQIPGSVHLEPDGRGWCNSGASLQGKSLFFLFVIFLSVIFHW